MKTKLIATLIGGLLLNAASAKEERAKVQLAILLDTSGSMDGLIEQTKTQLWKVVNTFISAKQNGQVPFVEVALYEYGNQGVEDQQNWIRQIQPLTRDLDQISQDLFSLKTNGGDEYCGAVIQQAVTELKWDRSSDVYKAIFIAGNEPFTQGGIKPDIACREAIAKGVIINTIHCGSEQVGLNTGWKSGALLADGSYLNIDQNAAVAHVPAPQDDELVKLGEALNQTYIHYGKLGAQNLTKQKVQDANAKKNAHAGAAVGRAVCKSSHNYWNDGWDLVDASRGKDFDWTKVKKEDLPKEMQELDLEGRKKYVADKLAKRAVIQKNIQELNKARVDFVTKKRAELAGEGEETLDVAVTSTVRDQAIKKGYQFE